MKIEETFEDITNGEILFHVPTQVSRNKALKIMKKQAKTHWKKALGRNWIFTQLLDMRESS